MPLYKEMTTPNGVAVSFHRAKNATVNLETGDMAALQVASWVTPQGCADGLGLAWMWYVSLPASALAGDIDAALANAEPFLGATPMDMPTPTPAPEQPGG